jgi:hypothetical protein
MSNPNTPFGLLAVQSPGKSIISHDYYIPSSYATALFAGDPVIKTGTSNSSAYINGRYVQPGSMPTVNKATVGDTNKITGVIINFDPSTTDFYTLNNPASTERIVHVCDDPTQIYLIRDDGVVALDQTVEGLNANLIYTNTGSSFTGQSGAALNSSTVATTATFQLKILRLHARIDNELGSYAIWEVQINNSTESNITAGI